MSDFQRTAMPLSTSSEPAIGPAPTLPDGRELGISVSQPGGLYRSLDGGRSVQQESISTFTPPKGGSVLSTGRGLAGQPVTGPGDIRSHTIFTLPGGMTVDADGMARLGYLTKTGENSYSLPDVGTEEARGEANEPPPQENAEPETFESLSPKATETFEAIDEMTGDPQRTEQMAFTTISHVLNGKPEVAAADIARNLNIPRAEASQLVSEMLADVTASVAGQITRTFHDVNGEEVCQWAAENIKAGELAPIAFQLAKGDRKVMKALVERYRQQRFVKAAGEGRVEGFEA